MVLKAKKAATPQELYRARKQREEEEKFAYLPPGLVNHGNTCFMNSVLQGLMATPLLTDAVLFSLPDNNRVVSPMRSPQLTNGHGVGGQYEHEWEQGMPLGDVFIGLMTRAWQLQEGRERTSLSPRDILARLGAKYDQYLDFRQQDAHELLRHLLDAMRMEEADVIKKRQPPPPNSKRRRTVKPTLAHDHTNPAASSSKGTSLSLNGASSDGTQQLSDLEAEKDRLVPFVDMLFGGQLASLLVCETCKKVSCTYEDFNDLSLSIKPEQWDRSRKRDRLRSLALRWKRRSGMENGIRAKSVPSSPTRKNIEHEKIFQEAQMSDPRRRSVDTVNRIDQSDENGSDDEGGPKDDPDQTPEPVVSEVTYGKSPIPEADTDTTTPQPSEEIQIISGNPETPQEPPQEDTNTTKNLPQLPSPTHGKDAESLEKPARLASGDEVSISVVSAAPEVKELVDDGWAKLGRRLSVTMGLGKKDKSRSKSKESKDSHGREKDKSKSRLGNLDFWTEFDIKAPVPTLPASSGFHMTPINSTHSHQHSNNHLHQRPHTSNHKVSGSPAIPSPSISPALSSTPTTYPSRVASPSRSKDTSIYPKPSRDEAAYLRRILADVPSTAPNPLAMFMAPLGADTSTSASGTAIWAKISGAQTLEDCLRMFTAVEALDGENMVGCHRCWKIQHGFHKKPSSKANECVTCDDDSSESDGEDKDKESKARETVNPNDERKYRPALQTIMDSRILSTPAILSTASTESPPAELSRSASTDGFPLTSMPSVQQSDSDSISSFAVVNRGRQVMPNGPEVLTTFGGRPIPSISTTAPDSMNDSVDSESIGGSRTATITTEEVTTPRAAGPSMYRTSSCATSSKDSLALPVVHHSRRSENTSEASTDVSSISSEDSDDGMESDALSNSLYSEKASVTPSQGTILTSPPSSMTKTMQPKDRRSDRSGIPRSKQIVLRRSYKRYLIASPPPVLVIHLKRFQQVGKTPVQLFGNFKKIDDFVSFPEYLDMKPYLLPKREDFGLKRGLSSQKIERNQKGDGKCMYRLYAVIVHIGNMLGGHYIAYTALPDGTPQAGPPSRSSPYLSESDALKLTGSSSGNSRTVSFEQAADARNSSSKHGHPPRKWCYISDTVVKLTTLEEVLKAKAYICMYERI